jgi:hypothetical protein
MARNVKDCVFAPAHAVLYLPIKELLVLLSELARHGRPDFVAALRQRRFDVFGEVVVVSPQDVFRPPDGGTEGRGEVMVVSPQDVFLDDSATGTMLLAYYISNI